MTGAPPSRLVSLAWRQARATVLAAVVMGAIISLTIIFWDFSQTRARIDATAEQLLRTASNSAVQASYTLDRVLAGEILDGLLEFETISEAEIVTEKGKTLAERSRAAVPPSFPDMILGGRLPYSKDLIYFDRHQNQEIPVGKLSIIINGHVAGSDFLARAIFEATLGLLRNFLMAMTSLMISRWLVTGPLSEVTRSLTENGIDELRTAVAPRSHEHDEIGQLVAAFNEIMAALSTSEARLRAAFDQSFVLFGILRTDGRLAMTNAVALNMIGRRAEDVTDVPFWETPWWHKEDDRDWLRKAVASIQDGELRRREVTHLKAGEPRTIDFLLSPINIGGRTELMAIGLDITDRKRAELDRERLLARLNRANAELVRFAEVTAHHLQEPSRRLAVFTQRLLHTEQGRLSEDAAVAAGFMMADAKYLVRLLKDMQLFLVADRPRADLMRADASVALAAVRSHVSAAYPDIDVTLDVDERELPDCAVDQPRLNDVFVMLADNSVKYRSPEREPVLRVSGRREGGAVIYRFEDNGLGVAEAYRNKVFGIFERLHPVSQQYPGTGIGLAIVRKVVESLGGEASLVDCETGACVELKFPDAKESR